MEIDNPAKEYFSGFISYFKSVITKRVNQNLNCFNYDISLKHLQHFSGENEVPFRMISKDWLNDFKLYLNTAKGLRTEKPLSINSANTYLGIVITVAKQAADQGLISHSVISGLTNTTRVKGGQYNALTFEELQLLARTDCRVPEVKKAFLFCCLTGIPWKDIQVLEWRHIHKTPDENWQIDLKGNGSGIVPLSVQVLDLLGPFGNANKKIFKLHYSAALCVNLNKWAIRAGILRKLSFNAARQTFGKMLIEQNVPIELVSELMGHQNVKSTLKFLSIEPDALESTKDHQRTFKI